MAIQQINGDPVTANSTKNDGGSVLNGGNTQELNSIDLGYSDVGVFGTAVIDGDDTDKALAAGTFSYNNQKPVAKRVTEELSGVENNYLQTGAGDPGNIRSIHKIEYITTRKLTTAIREGKWNEYSGEFDSGYPEVVEEAMYHIANNGTVVDGEPIDDAANPTRTAPGELVYKTGAPVPVRDDYKEKTG